MIINNSTELLINPGDTKFDRFGNEDKTTKTNTAKGKSEKVKAPPKTFSETVLENVFMENSQFYTKTGFKDYIFGMSLTELQKTAKIKTMKENADLKWLEAKDADGKQLYFLDKKLVGVVAFYNNDNERNLKALTDVFGKVSENNFYAHTETNQSRNHWQKIKNWNSVYFFPNTIASTRASWNASSFWRGMKEQVFFAICDRTLIERTVAEHIKANKPLLIWLKKITQAFENGKISKEMIPDYANTTIKDASWSQASQGVNFGMDFSKKPKTKKAEKPKEVTIFHLLTKAQKKLVTIERVNIGGYTDKPKGTITITARLKENPDAKILPIFKDHFLINYLFVNCNAVMVQLLLPPEGETITIRRETFTKKYGGIPEKVYPTFSWVCKGGWEVNITRNNEIILRREPAKGL